jgi:hypothetical protein
LDPERRLCDSVLGKIHEQIERTIHLTTLLPPDRLDWRPHPDAWPVAVLLGHLLDCLAGFCAVLMAAEPQRLAHFTALRDLPVNHACSLDEAAGRIRYYRDRIDEGFGLLVDADLGRPIATVFVSGGEPLLTLLLGNLEHLINHKHQLFTCLQQMGVEVSTRDLYRFREEDVHPEMNRKSCRQKQ